MGMRKHLEMPGLKVEFEGEAPLVDWARDVLTGARLPPHLKPVDEDAKTPPMQNIVRRGVRVNDDTSKR